ncbi:tail fiber domain-containing protein [Streptomyces sp. NPDC056773]|uniref:tail fiber domain-containing protein n=1 Tax=unclassified Streptomyces TaxID=2593676 RepID=UPI0036BF9061
MSESQFGLLFREFSDSGIAASASASNFFASADGTAMTVKVTGGFAVVRGHAVLSTATETLAIAAPGAAARTDRIVLRLDPAANSITLAVLQGTVGAAAPALTQTDTGIYELPLATVAVGSAVTTITAAAISPDRRFVGGSVGVWTTSTRPASPRLGKVGLNTSTDSFEFWTGSAWTSLIPPISWSSLTGKPSTFTPSTHGHKWADISDAPATLPPGPHTHPWSEVTGKPNTFPPESHAHSWSSVTSKPSTFPPASHGHDWDEVTGKPNSFPPSSHQHEWASVSGKPSTFPPSGHSHGWNDISGKPGQFPPTDHWHGQYLDSGGTISWANGSKQPHNNSASGSGTWYAVWVEGDGTFCRNTSSIRYKENVRDIRIRPEDVLALRPRIYDRKPTEDKPDARKDEYGLIAEEVAQTLPEIVTYNEEGQIDALRYDLLGVALLPVVQDQSRRITDLERRLASLEGRLAEAP